MREGKCEVVSVYVIQAYGEGGGLALLLLKLGTRYKLVVSITLRPNYPPKYPPPIFIGCVDVRVVIDVVSVMAAYYDLLCMCTHAQQVKIYHHNTDINIGTLVQDM